MKKERAAEESKNLKFSMLSKYTKLMRDPVKIRVPLILIDHPNYRNFYKANIIR